MYPDRRSTSIASSDDGSPSHDSGRDRPKAKRSVMVVFLVLPQD